jgi:hypothetical protein
MFVVASKSFDLAWIFFLAVASGGKDEADPAHPGRESDQVKVLGGGVHRA